MVFEWPQLRETGVQPYGIQETSVWKPGWFARGQGDTRGRSTRYAGSMTGRWPPGETIVESSFGSGTPTNFEPR